MDDSEECIGRLQLRGCLVALMQIVNRTNQAFHHPKAEKTRRVAADQVHVSSWSIRQEESK